LRIPLQNVTPSLEIIAPESPNSVLAVCSCLCDPESSAGGEDLVKLLGLFSMERVDRDCLFCTLEEVARRLRDLSARLLRNDDIGHFFWLTFVN